MGFSRVRPLCWVGQHRWVSAGAVQLRGSMLEIGPLKASLAAEVNWRHQDTSKCVRGAAAEAAPAEGLALWEGWSQSAVASGLPSPTGSWLPPSLCTGQGLCSPQQGKELVVAAGKVRGVYSNGAPSFRRWSAIAREG